MVDYKEISCRFCSTVVNNENFIILDEFAKEILNTVSPNQDLSDTHKHVMCSTCSIKLHSAFNFKSVCLYIEDKIASYINPKVSFVDLREVYLKEQDNKVKVEDDQRICRLCLQLVKEGFVSFHEMKLEMIHRYIPEVNFGITKDPLVCRQCFDSLNIHDTFMRTYLDAGTKIHNLDGYKVMYESLVKSENVEIKLGEQRLVNSEGELGIDEIQIKTEEIDIKFEEESNLPSCNLIDGTNDNEMRQICRDAEEIREEYIDKHDIEEVHVTQYDGPLYKCDNCDFETERTRKRRIKYHQSTHRDTSEIKMYKCDICPYETKYPNCLKNHQLTHKDSSKVQMYKCEICNYETKYKNHVKRHQIQHRDTSEIKMYKCDTCTFETRYKSYIKDHQLSHKHHSDIQIYPYKCEMCNYKTKFRNNLKIHQLTHKDPSEIQMYKCDKCSYETKYKYHVKTHQLFHKDPSEIQMYKCDKCSYETKYKNHLTVHHLKHKGPTETQMYKCNMCSYETKYKRNLQKHHHMRNSNTNH